MTLSSRRAAVAALAATALAACGNDQQPATAAPSPAKTATAVAAAKARTGATVGVRRTRYGRIIVDGKGLALYFFTADGRGSSKCYGECAAAWPPFTTKGRPRAVGGARASLVGTVRRRNGRKQVTYDGRPLYYWVGDREPGDVGCHDVFEFGGTWLVLRASGRRVP